MPRWDIFCTVIDNYGDIAVTWRLARQLAAEHGIAVRLWVDDLRPLAALKPAVDALRDQQLHAGVDIRRWTAEFATVDIADVVIEAFACNIPDAYISAMAASSVKPRWINLEYLSAENWVAGCHCLPSPHPRLPLVKHFFFPGFTAATGGLIREQGLIERRREFQASASQQAAFWQQLGLKPDPAAFKISLFSYENPALHALLQAWVNNATPILCVLPDGRLTDQVSAFFGTGNPWQRGNLTVHRLPFLDQDSYDQLLWACDMNFVRGEDSFVRALWAGQPLVWHIYPQADNAHQAKLDAFLSLYTQGLERDYATQMIQFWHGWNQLLNKQPIVWSQWQTVYSQFKMHHATFLDYLLQQPDLSTSVIEYLANTP